MVRKAKKKVPACPSQSSYTVRPSHHRPITKWEGMMISGALQLASIAFLSKVILHGLTMSEVMNILME